MSAHMVRDMNRQPPQIRLEIEPDGGVRIWVEVNLVGTGATRVSGREFVPSSMVTRLREIEGGAYDEAVRCTATALIAHHQGATRDEAARLASRSGSWLWRMVKLIQESGPDALIEHEYKESQGRLPRYPEQRLSAAAAQAPDDRASSTARSPGTRRTAAKQPRASGTRKV